MIIFLPIKLYLFQGPHNPAGRDVRDACEALLLFLPTELYSWAGRWEGVSRTYHHVNVYVSVFNLFYTYPGFTIIICYIYKLHFGAIFHLQHDSET